jgi:hypothetical protein
VLIVRRWSGFDRALLAWAIDVADIPAGKAWIGPG